MELDYCYMGNDVAPKSCVIVLPGRGQHAYDLVEAYARMGLDESVIIGISPEDKCWYPMPNGPNDQVEALEGIDYAIKYLEEAIDDIGDTFKIPRSKTAVLGFSAGGVMAIQLGARSKKPFACVICHGGAILDPAGLPAAEGAHQKMPVMLTHCMDDETFEWAERYVPMKEALENGKYKVYTREHSKGGHSLFTQDVIVCSRLLAKSFGYEF